ncbi:MAG TPA: polyprenyl synthetase family protein [Bacteroidales bacterium]|nr:polyprenyl synthetase family protein [Bacteroidales bacterium]HRR16152.1 polyprenyl synthetase family protein [Bacteroidales bacterium]HRU56420.1 polyprenyl synthetase family protein [Bacteroidales bacterium]
MYNQTQLKDLVEKALLNLSLPCEAPRLAETIRYILSAGGKRLRPVLALMACNIFTDKIDHAVLPAAGLEIFHNFTLVHDDIMDNAPVRRNLPTVHTRWNVNQAILSGDIMAFIATECFINLPPEILQTVLRIYNKAAIDVCTGQQLDLDYEKVPSVTESEYLRMIELKTASLIAASLAIGATLGGAGTKERDTLHEFGVNLGMAFQIQDDLLDVYGETRIFGKTSGGDIAAGKKTFLYIKAMEMATGELLKTLKSLYQDKNNNRAEKIIIVKEIYDTLNIPQITENLANQYISRAISTLKSLPVNNDRKEELMSLALSLTGRNI